MVKRELHFGIIGGGLMGREFASAAARWCHLAAPDGGTLPFKPRIVAVCDTNPQMLHYFADNFDVRTTTNYHELLADNSIDAIYCAVPHHLHAQLYVEIMEAGKHLLGEKPFGIDHTANQAIMDAVVAHPELVVRCSSEMPFFPGAYAITQYIREARFGQIIEVEAGFWHSSDLDPNKPINWKRQAQFNGEYGVLGDLGMHVVHIPFRVGWYPRNVRAYLSNIVKERPSPSGSTVPCDSWDNGILLCEVDQGEQHFPMTLSTKRIAPGEMNTWFIRIHGTAFSAEWSTKQPKTLRTLPYVPGGPQAWHHKDIGYTPAYPAITGSIFEFGFSDAILQMWAAFCDEVVNGPTGMQQPFGCATPAEAAQSHTLFTAALESHQTGQTVQVGDDL